MLKGAHDVIVIVVVCLSHSANILGKGMSLTILHTGMSKQ